VGSVEFYHSTGADDLVLTHSAVTVSASSNGKDWHLGVLELPRDGYADATEDIYFSGVYVESGDLTTSVSGGAANSSSTSSSSSSSIDIGTVTTLSTAVASAASSTTASIAPIITSSAIEAAATPTPSEPEDDDDDDCE